MRKHIVIGLIFIGNIIVSAQSENDTLFKYQYRLDVPSAMPYFYTESYALNWQDTGTSLQKYWDTIQYDISIAALDNELQPSHLFQISLLDSEKHLIQTFENKSVRDSMQIKWPPRTSYIVYDANFRRDTIYCYFPVGQIPTRVILVSVNDNELIIPVLKCQRRLTPLEMHQVYDAIRFKREAEITKCGICKLMFEI